MMHHNGQFATFFVQGGGYEKSSLIPINCRKEWMEDMKDKLNQKVVNIPFKYLGIMVGANPKRAQTWKPIIEKMEKKLSSWKMKILSKANRLVLIKVVLNCLTVYYMILFPIPKVVLNRIRLLQLSFLWGNRNRKKRIPLVK